MKNRILILLLVLVSSAMFGQTKYPYISFECSNCEFVKDVSKETGKVGYDFTGLKLVNAEDGTVIDYISTPLAISYYDTYVRINRKNYTWERIVGANTADQFTANFLNCIKGAGALPEHEHEDENTFATQAPAEGPGEDSNETPYEEGDIVITFADGTTLVMPKYCELQDTCYLIDPIVGDGLETEISITYDPVTCEEFIKELCLPSKESPVGYPVYEFEETNNCEGMFDLAGNDTECSFGPTTYKLDYDKVDFEKFTSIEVNVDGSVSYKLKECKTGLYTIPYLMCCGQMEFPQEHEFAYTKPPMGFLLIEKIITNGSEFSIGETVEFEIVVCIDAASDGDVDLATMTDPIDASCFGNGITISSTSVGTSTFSNDQIVWDLGTVSLPAPNCQTLKYSAEVTCSGYGTLANVATVVGDGDGDGIVGDTEVDDIVTITEPAAGPVSAAKLTDPASTGISAANAICNAKPDGSEMICGECAGAKIYLHNESTAEFLQETVTGLTGGAVSTWSSDLADPTKSILNFITPATAVFSNCEGKASNWKFDKEAWAFANGYVYAATGFSSLNGNAFISDKSNFDARSFAMELIIEPYAGGSCEGQTSNECPIVGTENIRDTICRPIMATTGNVSASLLLEPKSVDCVGNTFLPFVAVIQNMRNVGWNQPNSPIGWTLNFPDPSTITFTGPVATCGPYLFNAGNGSVFEWWAFDLADMGQGADPTTNQYITPLTFSQNRKNGLLGWLTKEVKAQPDGLGTAHIVIKALAHTVGCDNFDIRMNIGLERANGQKAGSDASYTYSLNGTVDNSVIGFGKNNNTTVTFPGVGIHNIFVTYQTIDEDGNPRNAEAFSEFELHYGY